MGTKISKKKFLRYEQAKKDYNGTHKIGDTPLELALYKTQSKANGLTERENWYILKHYGKLYVTHVEGYKYA